MATIISFKSAADVRARYPNSWNVTSGKWGQVCKKSFGPFIATIFFMYGQQIRWRVKELEVEMDNSGEFTKTFHTRGAGRAATVQAARNSIEDMVLPRLLCFYERRTMAKEISYVD
jgi:hypothetical protein